MAVSFPPQRLRSSEVARPSNSIMGRAIFLAKQAVNVGIHTATCASGYFGLGPGKDGRTYFRRLMVVVGVAY